MSLASFLPSHGIEHHVFRATVLPIVLTLAVSSNATLLCSTWCDARAAAVASECQHEDPANAPTVADDDSCNRMVIITAAFLPEEVRRDVSAPNAEHAILVPHHSLYSTTVTRPGHEAEREWSLEKRPATTALRI